VFGRRKQDQTLPAPQQPVKNGGKNRPTPRRNQQEARNKRPLVPSDRKLAARQAREASRTERLRARQAMMTGDDRYLPPRDKGPVRRYVRDFVDARWNVGEFFLIVAFVVVFLTFIQDPVIQLVGTGILWLTVIACVVDGFLLSRKLKRRLVDKFGEDQLPAGVVRYGVLRAFQLRRTRLPKPMVGRGQYPQ
jgi:hypothetical protein